MSLGSVAQVGPLKDGQSSRFPGDLLLHPVALIALVLVIVNDRVLKIHFPSAFTGKLSDFAGLIYFPLFVVALIEGARWLVNRRRWELGPRSVMTVSLIAGIILVLIKTWSPAAEIYRSYLGVILWPAYLLGDLIQGRGFPEIRRVGVVEDGSDLIALVVLVLPVWLSTRVMGSTKDDSAGSESAGSS